MKVITGKVVNGKVELPRGALPEGSSVAVVAPDESEPIGLSPAQEQELTEALEAITRGEFVDGDELLANLAEELSELYEPDEARLWLFCPHKLLGGDRPADRIQGGRVNDVLALIAQLKDGAYV